MKYILLFLIIFNYFFAQAKLNIVTTTSSLQALVNTIGGQRVAVSSISKSTQDPHFVEAKPSYMVQLHRADLLVAVGLDLEVGWLVNVQRGAKNPALLLGNKGFFAAGDYIQAIEVPHKKVDRSEGDVHPLGNPHFHLDPLRFAKVGLALANKMAELDSDNASFFQENAKKFKDKIEMQMPLWKKQVLATGIKKVITYHKSFNYFLNRFDIQSLGTIEPKPGIPPTIKHIVDLISLVKTEKVKCVLNENYFETSAAERIKKDTGVNIQVLPVEVDMDYFVLIQQMIRALMNCAQES
ncbi:MAG: zinc ABC transporter substrate-binding protein [Bdellovibrionales bacterium]|nr:zinc ABC transporter substrate-binding protein [Bdellovibrionales bacterium]